MGTKFLVLIFLFGAICCTPDNSDAPLARQDKSYAFYYPLSVVSHNRVKVCLAINKALLPAKVEVSFENRTCEHGRSSCGSHTVKTGFSCWKIKTPSKEGSTLTNIKVEIRTEHGVFIGKEQVQIRSSEKRIFIETDRRTYKMGDTVRIRLLALRHDLKPAKHYTMPAISIRSPFPSGTIVKVWNNITAELGLAHVEFELASDAPEGDWAIIGEEIFTTFKVEKYVLPRFQVTLNGPNKIYNNTKSITYTLCGIYSYGRGMKGVALLKLEVNHHFLQDPSLISEIKNLTNGCAKFKISAANLGLPKKIIRYISITGSITEEGTNQMQSTDMYVSMIQSPYSYEWEDSGIYYKPSLPYKAKLILTDSSVSLENALVNVCYEEPWLEVLACSNFTIGADNTLDIIVPPIQNRLLSRDLQITAKIFDHPASYAISHYLIVWHSFSRNAIRIISKQTDKTLCESTLRFAIFYNTNALHEGEAIEFKYILSSRDNIVDTGSVSHRTTRKYLDLSDYPNVIGEATIEILVDDFELEIDLPEDVFTLSRLVVYYEYNGEIISDAIDVDIKACSPNKVDADWSENVLYPGEIGSLNIQADPNSLCSISSTDKASTFLRSSRGISLHDIFLQFSSYAYINKLNCISPGNADEPSNPLKRYAGSGVDTYEALKDSNIGIISNMHVIAKKCEEVPEVQIRHKTPPISEISLPNVASDSNRGSTLRSFFPETWLWDLVHIGDGGQVVFRKMLPDSITEWEGNVICTSSTNGVGISDKIEIKSFKPFFIDILLPYSIKREKEILHLLVPVYNYLNDSLPIRIFLITNEDITLVDGDDKDSFTICLRGGDSYTHTYRIKANSLGTVKLTVTADVDPDYVDDCTSESIVKQKDAVQKTILVEPEGYPSQILKSTLLCANDVLGINNIDWSINLPADVVSDTVNGKVTINSDILGPMCQNFDDILGVPTGGGEQTMAALTPNLYVLKYLEANGELHASTKEKILKNLEIGYQRMLNYVHNDGSFSAFGQSDKSGSMFLTAFVVRTFKQMQKYTYVADTVIDNAVKWIISHQLDNGCFDPVRHVLHKMGIANFTSQTTALTSYVLISFLETGVKVNREVIDGAKECVTKDLRTDNYTLAISSYALALMNLEEDVIQRFNRLLLMAESQDGLMWWTESESSLSANVETSSYALIALLQQDPVENFGIATAIVKWLQTQMNPRGGFYTTQDTVMALDAISRYATLINKEEPNAEVTITTKTDTKILEITKRDKTKVETLPLVTYPNEVKASIKGKGCISLQAIVNYYVDKSPALEDLRLDIDLKPTDEKLNCSFIELTPCVSYAPEKGQINMAIVEVNMPSGFVPAETSLYELTSTTNTVKKFELKKNQVIFYLTELTNAPVCMPFRIEENLHVENAVDAIVKFYDYYKPELSISKTFSTNCTTNESVVIY